MKAPAIRYRQITVCGPPTAMFIRLAASLAGSQPMRVALATAGQTTNATIRFGVDSNNATQVMDGYCLNCPVKLWRAKSNERNRWLAANKLCAPGGTNPALVLSFTADPK